jgi:hypothetical protein
MLPGGEKMSYREILILVAWMAVWCLCTIGCDGGEDEDQPVDGGQDSLEEIQCKDMMSQLCNASCNCAVNAANCMYFYQSEDLFTQYDNLDGCIRIENELNCFGNLAGKDFATCILALQTAPCGELFGEPGLELPTACDPLVQ